MAIRDEPKAESKRKREHMSEGFDLGKLGAESVLFREFVGNERAEQSRAKQRVE